MAVQAANQAKDTAKKGMQVAIAIAVIVAVIFAIVLVIRNLDTVLWGLGILVVLAFIIWIIVFNKKKKDTDNEETDEE